MEYCNKFLELRINSGRDMSYCDFGYSMIQNSKLYKFTVNKYDVICKKI
jgi:hypothetical protein